jgi:hypothetical protein
MSNESLSIIAHSYDLYKKIVELNNHAEKRWRYSLCMTTEKILLDFISNLFMAQYAPKKSKAPFLLKASAQYEILSIHNRIYMEFQIANQTQLYQIRSILHEIGHQLGGWLKSSYNL